MNKNLGNRVEKIYYTFTLNVIGLVLTRSKYNNKNDCDFLLEKNL